MVRSLGLIGQGEDPMEKAMALTDPVAARDLLREEERQRIREIRQIVLNATNNVPYTWTTSWREGPSAGEHAGQAGRRGGLPDPPGPGMFSRPEKDSRGDEVLDADGQREMGRRGGRGPGDHPPPQRRRTLPALPTSKPWSRS